MVIARILCPKGMISFVRGKETTNFASIIKFKPFKAVFIESLRVCGFLENSFNS
jgi:hypothetical protein